MFLESLPIDLDRTVFEMFFLDPSLKFVVHHVTSHLGERHDNRRALDPADGLIRIQSPETWREGPATALEGAAGGGRGR